MGRRRGRRRRRCHSAGPFLRRSCLGGRKTLCRHRFRSTSGLCKDWVQRRHRAARPRSRVRRARTRRLGVLRPEGGGAGCLFRNVEGFTVLEATYTTDIMLSISSSRTVSLHRMYIQVHLAFVLRRHIPCFRTSTNRYHLSLAIHRCCLPCSAGTSSS